ncbi:hypothetical protein [Gordonia malaquae]|uniref:hypothetical protein n=1 Tax=Gordonia malaquae TaxID=410332 RepID=UPI0021D79872|nr:hypothetical protein [Gordonia malaquae]
MISGATSSAASTSSARSTEHPPRADRPAGDVSRRQEVRQSTGGGSVWLDPELTSPYAWYQYFVNTADADVVGYLKWFTFLSREEIAELEQATGRSRSFDSHRSDSPPTHHAHSRRRHDRCRRTRQPGAVWQGRARRS